MTIYTSSLFSFKKLSLIIVKFFYYGVNNYCQHVAGIIQTWNYAINGRHLADQDYNICIRQEASEFYHKTVLIKSNDFLTKPGTHVISFSCIA